MPSEQKYKHSYSAKRDAEMKLRRREMYSMASVEKRENHLLQQRSHRDELKRIRSSEPSLSPGTMTYEQKQPDRGDLKRIRLSEASLSLGPTICAADYQEQNRPSSDSSFALPTSNESCVDVLSTMFDKQKNVTSSFHAFEVGSTSGTSKNSYSVSSDIVRNKGLDQRVHNLPSTSEVAAIWTIKENVEASMAAREAREVYFERNIIVTEEELLLEKKLNKKQRVAYGVIINRIFSNRPGAFFIDGPGGTAAPY